MKRVGILTIHNSPNYGASLQSYALYKYVSQLPGIECEVIDLHRPYEDGYVKSNRFVPYRGEPFSIKKNVKSVLKKILRRESKKVSFYSIGSKYKFDEFNKGIKLSRPYWGINELYADPPCYDVYMTGSDQVWNPTQPYCLEPYFLTFVPQGKKKISYASSIGVTELLESEKQDFRRWLSSYDAISVREHQAKDLLASFVNKPITQVADPTFLLDSTFWRNIAVNYQQTEPYILLFTVGFDSNLLQFAMKISNESGLCLIYLNQKLSEPIDGSYKVVNDAGPRDFLGLIAQSEMVLTDSYHATVFSLILKVKNFYAYIGSYNKRGSRILDLLKTYKEESHLLSEVLSENYTDLSKRKIDYQLVDRIYREEQMKAHDFLKSNLL